MLILVLAKMGKHQINSTGMETSIVDRLYEFMENEARSCSMDFACVTPLYVYRTWGGTVPVDEIAEALQIVKSRLW